MREQMKAFIERSRWFGGKGRDLEVTGSRRLPLPGGDTDPESGRTVVVELVTVSYAGGEADLYQVPVAYYAAEQPTLHHALIGQWEDDELGAVWAYDALHDHAATPLWLHAFVEGSSSEQVVFHPVGEPALDPDSRSTLLSGEQSNSSVAFGDESLMKLFRRVTPGQNPDIEILAALTEAGNEHVAALFGWVDTTTEDGEVLQLGILQQFLRTASDGWELALASLRNLYANDELSAREAGGDFASEAHRLGLAVAEMHESLAASFPTEEWDRNRLGELADAMSGRLEAALDVVPQLREHASGLHAVFDAVRHIDRPVTAQRVHGDLHLGQTLRTVKNWKIIDFEGEPAKSLEERRRPDSAWRDVAGMLRSFDYAAELSRMDQEQAAHDTAERTADRGQEWSERNVTAFLTGYQEASGGGVDHVLVAAYAADKAVYEAVYEARNRPSWLPIPMAALSRLAAPA
jgi:maltokinase